MQRPQLHHGETGAGNSAGQQCTTLASKKVTPHALRHTTAMSLPHAGVDTAVIDIWLGHADTRSTQLYLHSDMTIKEPALARTTSPNGVRARAASLVKNAIPTIDGQRSPCVSGRACLPARLACPQGLSALGRSVVRAGVLPAR